jgi:hypothetical protein
MSADVQQRVIVLWDRHRRPPLKASADSAPGNTDKGVRELQERGYAVVSLYPSAMRYRLVHRFLGQRGIYKTTFVHVLRVARRTAATIYTSSIVWAHIVARLKRMGLLKNRLVFRWAGVDTDIDAVARRLAPARAELAILEQADVCILASAKLYNRLCQILPRYESKLQFWPTGVDANYYRELKKREPASKPQWDLVAIGSDHKRNWALPLELATRGLSVALVTDDAAAEKFLRNEIRRLDGQARLFYKVGFEESARVVLSAKSVLVATVPNVRFSGSTTVGVAAALSKPLILDDIEEAPAYGLFSGRNCETFERGNAQSAAAAVFRIVTNDAYADRLARGITPLADELDLAKYATALEDAIRSTWTKRDFQTSTVPN